MTDAERLDLLCLTMVPGVGPVTCRALIDRYGSAGAALRASESSLRQAPGVGPKVATRIAAASREQDPEDEIAECTRAGAHLVAFDEDEYPSALSEIPDPPAVLYIRGQMQPIDALAIGIVGSRHATPYGLRMADRLASGLARIGITVVSGLARGIDASAHRAALRAGGRTLAVLANGLSQIYPPEHDELAREIAESGAVLSEMPMRQSPLAQFFTRRNRIISGLCLGVVVVEATPRSGSLSTARHATEQNREVFAVPGPADSLSSRGCHRLIRDGAKLVETVDDIIEELGPLVHEINAGPNEVAVRHPVELTLSDHERSLLGLLGDRPLGVDDLILQTRLTAQQVISTLTVLEMRRLVRKVPGNLFIRP